jgi:sulfite reductase beta subunit-like hemoprotein
MPPLGLDGVAVSAWFDELVEAEAPVLDGSLAAEREAAETYARMDEIANARMVKKQRMRWSPHGADRVTVVRAAVLNGRLKPEAALPLAA